MTPVLTVRATDAAGASTTASAAFSLLPRQRTLLSASYLSNTDPLPLEKAAAVYLGRSGTVPLGGQRVYYQANEVAACVTAIKRAADAGRQALMASFKFPDTWAKVKTGSSDIWIGQTINSVSAAADAYDIDLYLTPWHEPENDQSPISDWVASCARIFRTALGAPRVIRTPVLTGYPQTFNNNGQPDTNGPFSYANMWVEGTDVLASDPYLLYWCYPETYGVGTPNKHWLEPSDAYFPGLVSFANSKGVPAAIAETAQTDESFNSPLAGHDGAGWMARQFAAAQAAGMPFWSYFASNLNSRGSWWFGNNPAKQAAFVRLLASTALVGS